MGLVQLVVVAAVAAGSWWLTHHVPYPPFHDLFDLHVYQGAAQWWRGGNPLYDYLLPGTPYGFTYPPFAAVVMAPLASVGFATAAAVHTSVNVLLAAAAAIWLAVPIARRAGWSPWFTAGLAVPIVLLVEPVRETLGFGQVNLLLGALVAADVIALRRGWRWAGVGIGLATAIKLTPGLFVLYLLVTRRWLASAVAIGTALAATLGTYAVAPGTSRQFWTHTLWESDRIGQLDQISNQSLQGLLARLALPDAPDSRLWAALCVVVVAVGLARARRAQRLGDEVGGATLIGITSCLVSPISWTHHLYWFVPAIAVLLDVAVGAPRGGRTVRAGQWLTGLVRGLAGLSAAGITAVLASGLLWHFGTPGPAQPHPVDLLGRIGENSYVLLLIGLLLLLPARAGAPSGPPADDPGAPAADAGAAGPRSAEPAGTPG